MDLEHRASSRFFFFWADDVIVSFEVIVSPGQREGRGGQEQRGKASSTAASGLNTILLKSSHNTTRSSAVFPRNYLLLESTSTVPPPGTPYSTAQRELQQSQGECVAHSFSEQPRAHDMICRRLTPLTRISVRLGQCLGFHVGSKSEATTARPTSWAQAEGHRRRGFLVNPKHSQLLPPSTATFP